MPGAPPPYFGEEKLYLYLKTDVQRLDRRLQSLQPLSDEGMSELRKELALLQKERTKVRAEYHLKKAYLIQVMEFKASFAMQEWYKMHLRSRQLKLNNRWTMWEGQST
ncbi:hypothetical protein FRB90_000061 [Tulasnella sp. 427]|nr:hypothetical protein FRB90_000061 [Tulasnella sp. 427]